MMSTEQNIVTARLSITKIGILAPLTQDYRHQHEITQLREEEQDRMSAGFR